MFNNVGKKLQTVSQVLFWVGVIGVILHLIGVFFTEGILYIQDIFASKEVLYSVVSQIIWSAFAVFALWVTYLMLYAFGQLVDDASKIRKALQNIEIARKPRPAANDAPFSEQSEMLRQKRRSDSVTDEQINKAIDNLKQTYHN